MAREITPGASVLPKQNSSPTSNRIHTELRKTHYRRSTANQSCVGSLGGGPNAALAPAVTEATLPF